MSDGGDFVTLYNYKETWRSLSRLFQSMGVEWSFRDKEEDEE